MGDEIIDTNSIKGSRIIVGKVEKQVGDFVQINTTGQVTPLDLDKLKKDIADIITKKISEILINLGYNEDIKETSEDIINPINELIDDL